MRTSEIEELLRRYRPLGPPPDLRTRLLSRVRLPRLWPWTLAAAAALLTAVACHGAIGVLLARTDIGPAVPLAQISADEASPLTAAALMVDLDRRESEDRDWPRIFQAPLAGAEAP